VDQKSHGLHFRLKQRRCSARRRHKARARSGLNCGGAAGGELELTVTTRDQLVAGADGWEDQLVRIQDQIPRGAWGWAGLIACAVSSHSERWFPPHPLTSRARDTWSHD